MPEITPEQERELHRNSRNNLIFTLAFFALLSLAAYASLPSTTPPTPSAPGVSPDVFATLLVAEAIGVLELARLMRGTIDETNFSEATKHFNRFFRLLIVSVGSSLVGLIVAVITPVSWLSFGLLIVSAFALFFILFFSLDYVFV